MNKHIIGLLLFNFLTSFCWSQSFSVSGIVQDELGQPMPFVNVYVSQTSDNEPGLIKGATTEDDGTFIIENLEQISYDLTASFLGFKTHKEKIVVDGNLNLSIVLNEAVETLSEVEIVVKRPTLRRESDRLVFSVANTTLSEGDVMEVLRRTPGVLVLDDVIKVKNLQPTIYINDRKIHLSPSEVTELLQGTSASTIQSVEVITNPSARYDAESGVVLNIVMAKNLISGYNGSVFSNYTQGVFPKMNYGSSNFFKGNKVNFYLNYSYNNRKIDRISQDIVNYLDANGDVDENWLSDINRNTWSETHSVNMNFDYDIDEKNTLSISSNLLFLPYFKYVIKNQTSIDDNQGVLISKYNSNNLSRDKKHNIGLDLNFRHKFNDKSSIIVNTHYTSYDYKRKQNVNSSYFDSQDIFIGSTAYNTQADQDTEIVTGQIDYTVQIDESASLEMGAKASNIKTESSLFQNDIINGQEVVNIDNTDAFKYDEQVYASYVGFSKNWEKVNLRIGIRAEQTQVEGISEAINETNSQDYLKWFPNTSLSYQASENVSLYSSYKRSIQRPAYSELNPFKFFLNDNNVVSGNPNLQPVFIDHFIGGASYKNRLFFEVYYKNSKGNIYEIPIQDNDTNIIDYTPFNLESTKDLGFDFIAIFNPTEWWSIYAVTSFYQIKDEFNFNGIIAEQSKWSNTSIWNNDFTFLKDRSLKAGLYLIYFSANLQGLQVVDDRVESSLVIRKTLLKGKGTLSVSVNDIFNNQDFFIRTKFLNQDNSLFHNLDNRYVRVGFRYSFGNTKLSSNEKALEKEERDRLE